MAEAAAAPPAIPTAPKDDEEYRISFNSQSLGMRLKLIHGKILVTNFLRDGGTGKMRDAEAGGVIRIGDRVVAVAGTSLATTTFKAAITMIMSEPRPIELTFRRGPGDYMGRITHDNARGKIFGTKSGNDGKRLTRVDSIRLHKANIFGANSSKAVPQIARVDSMRVHKAHLGSHTDTSGDPPATAAPASDTPISPIVVPKQPNALKLKSCLKKPGGPGGADASHASPKKNLSWSDQNGRDLEQVWFADNTHYSTPRQRRLGIYTPRMEDPCVVS